LVKCHERRLIPLAFFALLFENELKCHGLNMCANSGDDVAISCKNLVNFCRVTSEIKAHSHQARLRPSTSVDGRRRRVDYPMASDVVARDKVMNIQLNREGE